MEEEGSTAERRRNATIGKKYLALSARPRAVAHCRLGGRNKCNVVTESVGNGVTAGHPYIDKLLATTVALIAKAVSPYHGLVSASSISAPFTIFLVTLSDVTHLRMAKLGHRYRYRGRI